MSLLNMVMVEAAPAAGALGWTLLHFLWQGAVIAAILAAVLSLQAKNTAHARYLTCCAGMALMMAAPLVTFLLIIGAPAAPIAGLVQGLAGLELSPTLWQRLAAFLPTLTIVWLLGVLVTQARLMLQLSHAQHMKRHGTSPVPPHWQQTVARLCGQLVIARTVRIVESSLARVPTLIGYLQPVILLPTAVMTGLTSQQLRAVIAHELAHIRRHDYLVNLIQAFFESLLFYHPAVWWLSGRLRVEREYCCDDIAVSVGGDRLCYAQALSSLDVLRAQVPQPALASTGGSLMNRIRRLAGVQMVPSRGIGGWMAPLLVTASVLAIASAASVAVAVDRPEHRPHAEAEVNAIDRIDIVALLREHEVEHAEVIATLREGGLNNRQLMGVLGIIGTNSQIMGAIRAAAVRAAERAAFVAKKMHDVRDAVQRDLAGGRITEREAHRRLELAQEKLQTWAKAREARRRSYHREGAAFERRLENFHAEIKEDLAFGRITEDQAKRRLDEVRRDVLGEWPHERPLRKRRPGTNVSEGLFAVLKTVHEDLAAGRITEAEAHERLAEAKERFEFHREHDVFDHQRDRRLESKLQTLRARVEDDLAAGRITEAEAAERLKELRQKRNQRRRPLHRPHEEIARSVRESVHNHLVEILARRGVTEKEARSILDRVHRELDGREHREGRRPRREQADFIVRVIEQVADTLAARGVPEDEIKKVLEHVHRDLDARHKVFDKWQLRREAERRVKKHREKLRETEEPEGDG
ncbi:MAG: M48 family metalloprotease [Planctomycetes bacterium]|nr:M48 family metalloprotease [Planctomycetota bacterium]